MESVFFQLRSSGYLNEFGRVIITAETYILIYSLHLLRFTSGATPANLLTASMAGGNCPHIDITLGVNILFVNSRGFAVGIYATNSAEACHYVAYDCEANICVVENDAQLQKILQVRDRLPHLRAIIQYTGELKEKYSDVYTVGIIYR